MVCCGVCRPESQGKAPAYSIVLSGGYKDDHDQGVTSEYTGEGGQDGSKRQASHGNVRDIWGPEHLHHLQKHC